ncbi:MAG TPA: glycosyltransferase family 39 protein [Terriglobales bacterium]|nr:glycosyltransferase family 39 protein [Terriglobales bacterium]
MRQLLRQSWRFFVVATLVGLGLRLLFVFLSPQVTDDSRIYADLANNWLAHGIYGISEAGEIVPTYIRLPGYPAFLAAVFAVFRRENFRAVLLLQVLVDLGTCLLIADIARRIISSGAARVAFLLAALCPFLANYTAAVLTETLEIFFTTLALDLAVVGLGTREEGGLKPWFWCGLAVAANIFLRPDGGLLLAAIGVYLLVLLARFSREKREWNRVFGAGVVLAIFSLAPLIPWTVRNWRALHQFEPLTPRYASNPGDYVPKGFNRWVKTWIADYVSVQEIYWQEPGEKIDPAKLPARAFDSPEQKQLTLAVLDAYNQTTEIDPELDAQFAQLAQERIRAKPLRYYLWLPALRIADMWLRPRTELLPVDPRWWEFNDDLKWSVTAVGFGIMNLIYVGLAVAGMTRGQAISWVGLLVLFAVLRSAFLGTLENPEPRYTLECYPLLIVMGAAAVKAGLRQT